MSNRFSLYSDEDLIAKMGTDDVRLKSEIFSVLYDRYEGMVRSYCLVALQNRENAEDLLQEVFIKFYHSLNENRNFSNVPGFLITITRNLCLNTKRNKKTNVDITEMEFADDSSYSFENKELLELIISALDVLDEKHRQAFILREFQGLPFAEIGKIENVSEANAKNRVARAKQKIIQVLQPYINDIEKN